MNRTVLLGVSIFAISFLGGCTHTYHSHSKSRFLPENTSVALNVAHPVAVKNACPKTPGEEELLGKWWGWEVKGSLYDFTESTVGIATDVMQRKGVKLDSDSERRLELTVVKAESKEGFWTFSSQIWLKVKTGSGIEREYTGVKHHQTGYATTKAFEMMMARCVEDMLTDRDILNYLQQ